ncbi:histidine phosphatase family protein [Phocaeicola plebeius]|uniref:histidine phosphatase family protein n=1 Tax=Phocaeicola plebeius TaxID=310297 RepID=UPI0019571019|nr:histidine phosphatase family protein [Phocaeicola plebeius]MBM6844030.1 histidine phosphatase family protein [Phocaeicola plebeius]
MITLYLARHGQTVENLSRIFQGHLPGILTEEGKKQAMELGESLRDIALDAVVSSDLQRVVDTVQLAVGSRQLPWQQTTLLREIDWGPWTGLSVGSVDLSNPPSGVETRQMMYDRAGAFLDYLWQHYDGKRVLVVAHGQINRYLEARITGVPLEELRTVPLMKNAELHRYELTRE